MALHHGPDGPDPSHTAAIDDAAVVLLTVWDEVRERVVPRVSGPQLAALLVVERGEGINLRGLASRLRMILSSASRLCDRLVAAGLLEREPGQVDRREIALYLTPAGHGLLDELRVARRQRLATLLDRMTPTGRTALLRGLGELAAVASSTAAGEARSA